MPSLTRSVRGSGNQLLYNLLEEPQLLAAVRELPAPVLVRLIHHVGLEDAGELIALTSTQQLAEVFDAELWQSAEPGSDETFRPDRFALFLHLLYEAGESFVVERLLALPRKLLTLAFHKLLLVIDIDALTVRFNGAGKYFDDGMDRVTRAIEDSQFEEWEEFRLIARDQNAFEDVWNALLALDREDHELVRDVIERCCDMDGELIEESGLYAVLNDEDMLENDMVSERSERRAAAGFVAPADARAFLELARRESTDEAPDGRDPISRAYFRELAVEQPALINSARSLPEAHRSKDQRAQPNVGRLLAMLREANVLDDAPAAPAKARILTSAQPARSVTPAIAAKVAETTTTDEPPAVLEAAANKNRGKSMRGAEPPARGKTSAGKTKQVAERPAAASDHKSRAAERVAANAAAKGRERVAQRQADAALVQAPADVGDHSSDSDRESGARRLTLMAASLLVLRERDAAVHAQRSEELGFLANVLVAGSRHDGRPYRPVEAIECALAVCSVGLEYEYARLHAKPPRAQDASVLLGELSADRLFRAGVRALRVEIVDRARAQVAHALGIKLNDVPAAVSGGSEELITQLAIEADSALALAALAEPEPWLAGCLADPDHIFIASHKDIDRAREFLSAHEHDTTRD